MRVLLALPPDIHKLEIYRVTGINAPPLGLAWIASVLENYGHKVKIVDSPTLKITRDQFLHIVKSWKPEVIGLSIQTPMAPKAYDTIRILKRLYPDIPVVVGGIHPTFMYKEALNHGADVVVRGEGEYTTLELINLLEERGLDREALRNIMGLAFKDKDGKIITTKPRPHIWNLDELPWPARHLLPMEHYTVFGKQIRLAHVMASRGCPYGCIFCSTSYFWGRCVRFRSPRNVADEIEYLVNKYNVRYIVFSDDELLINRKFVQAFINEMRERKIDIQFACGARVDHVDRDILKLLYNSGCTALYFGVESSSQETLNKIGKGISVDQIVRAFNLVKEVGGFATASFILGFPWETLDDMKNTIEFSVKLKPDYVQFTALTPYPGTPIYDYALRNNLITDWNWEHYTTIKPVMRGFYFTAKQLERMLKLAYRKFYLRWEFIWRELRYGRLKDLLPILLKEVYQVFKELLRGEKP